MINIRQKRQRGKVLFLFLLLLIWGCASEKTARKEPFFEKWNTAAQEATGHSPAPRVRVMILPEIKTVEGEEPVKRLSKEKVTLKMRGADVKSVIRSLARVSGKNVLVKNDVKGEINVDFTNVPWDEAFNSILKAQGLSYIWDGVIIRVLSLEDMEHSLKMVAQVREGKKIEPLATMVVSVDYAAADALKDTLQEFLTKEKDGKTGIGSVKVDKHSNSLVIQAIRDDLARMVPIIEKIDKPTVQINIKANIVETSKAMARDLGIQWGGMYGTKVGKEMLYVTPGGSSAGATGTGTALDPRLSGSYNPTSRVAGIGGQGFGVNFPATAMSAAASSSLGLIFGTIGGNLLEMQLNALQKDSKLNILSSPSITTLDNQMAFTENGERVPYVSTTAGTGGGAATQDVKFEDAVLRLEITPHVIDGKNIKMKILVKKDEVDTTRNVQGNPYIIKKQTETTLIVEDGETIVISGLSKQRNSYINSGVPGLKDVPGLGWLFKGEGKGDEMQEVLIFITPTILPLRQTAAGAGGQDKAVGAGDIDILMPPPLH